MLYKLVWLLAYITPSIIADTASVFTTSMKQAIISERIVYKSDSIHVSLLPGDCNGAKKHVMEDIVMKCEQNVKIRFQQSYVYQISQKIYLVQNFFILFN